MTRKINFQLTDCRKPSYCVFIGRNDYDAENECCKLYKHNVFEDLKEAQEYAEQLCQELEKDGWQEMPIRIISDHTIFEKNGKQCHVNIHYF